jgi:flavin reductase (DIM6/NTAB) family NADH-FMN oxidoreductase RutF
MSIAAASNALFELLDCELWLVTAGDESKRGGLIATFVSQASIVPELPRVIVGIARQHHTWELIEARNAFALHLLAEEHLDWVWRFGLHSGREVDKFEGLSWEPGRTGSPLLKDPLRPDASLRASEVLGWLDCRVEARLETGDRTVYLAEVVEAAVRRPGQPLTVRRLLQLAPKSMLAQLKAQLQHDAAVDAKAIETWRRSQ